MADFNWDDHPVVGAKSFSWDDHPVVDGTKDNPIESDIFGSDKDRTKASFGDPKGVGRMLMGKGFINVEKNKNGDLVAKKSDGTWHKDATGLLSHPINWAESGAGKALPLAGGIAGGLAGIESGPGAIAAAAGGGAAGEAARSSIGRGMGVYDGDVVDQAKDMGKEGATMALGEGLGRYAVAPAARSFANSGLVDAATSSAGRGLTKLGSEITGVTPSDIRTYAKHGPEIDSEFANHEGNLQDMADETKQGINEKVSKYKGGLNDQISDALKTAPEDKNIDVFPVIEKLQAARDKMARNPNMNKQALKELDDLLLSVKDPMKVTKNVALGYDAPNEKAATITHEIAAGGPQKKFILHAPDDHEAHLPMAPGEVMSDIPGQNGSRSVPVLDTTVARPGEGPVPTAGALDLLGQKTMSRPGIANKSQEILSEPHFDEGDQTKAITDPGNSPDDSVLSFPLGKQKLLETGEESMGRPDYHANLNGLQDIKKFLQDEGSPAYGGTALQFQKGKIAQNEAKNAGGVARDLMNRSAESLPNAQAITGANAKLSRLHDIEDVMNRNLLEDGKTSSPLFAAGSGNNQQSENVLRDLGGEIGHNVLGDAQRLSAARTFGNPSWLPTDTTGKSLTRKVVAGTIGGTLGGIGGYLAGGAPGAGVLGAIGTGIGEGLASPAALKLAINTGRGLGQIAQSPLIKAVTRDPHMLQAIANPELRSLVSDAVDRINEEKNARGDETHYDPWGEKSQPVEAAKQKFLEGN